MPFLAEKIRASVFSQTNSKVVKVKVFASVLTSHFPVKLSEIGTALRVSTVKLNCVILHEPVRERVFEKSCPLLRNSRVIDNSPPERPRCHRFSTGEV